jgi:RNA polymerase sigma factor (sigma-70 family)
MPAAVLEETSEALVLRVAAGNSDALTTLYRRHRAPLIRKMLRKVLDKQPEKITQHADEIADEVWHEVAKSAKSFKSKSRFMSWVTTIARRKCSVRVPELHATYDEALTGGVPALAGAAYAGSTAEEEAEMNERDEMLAKSVMDLPPEQQRVFVLRYERALKWPEIVKETGLPQSTVYGHYMAAVAKLRSRLNPGAGPLEANHEL